MYGDPSRRVRACSRRTCHFLYFPSRCLRRAEAIRPPHRSIRRNSATPRRRKSRSFRASWTAPSPARGRRTTCRSRGCMTTFLKATGDRPIYPLHGVDRPREADGHERGGLLARRVEGAGVGDGDDDGAAGAGAKPGNKDDKKPPRTPAPTFSYEDLGTTTLAMGQTAPIKFSRSFTVPAGTYDVYVLVKEPPSDKKNAPAPRMSVVKQTVVVPDLWNDELNTSSVIVAERIDPLPAPLTPQQMIDRPYAMGPIEIVPAIGGKFTKKDELQPFLLIYNAKTDSANKPDVTVEYQFLRERRDWRKGSSSTRRTPGPERQDAAAAVRFRRGAPAAERAGRAAGVVPRGRLPARDYRDRQDREQEREARRQFLGERVVAEFVHSRPAERATSSTLDDRVDRRRPDDPRHVGRGERATRA